jgi:hypothetical protein
VARVYRLLQEDLSAEPRLRARLGKEAAQRWQLGQPVNCGRRDGIPVSALRLCVGARQIVAAQQQGGAAVIAQALAALDKAAALV